MNSFPVTKGVRAFTLLELLVVIAVIGILAALLLLTLSSAKRKASQSTCINNQRQLALGMKMYVDENNGVFPGVASRRFGYQPADWIYWRTNTTLYPLLEKSPILNSIPHANRALLRCPLDTSDADRLAYAYDEDPSPGDGPYLFSYGFTGYGLDETGRNVGMSSVLGTYQGDSVGCPFKESSVRNPAQKIMLAEEPGSLSGRDSPGGVKLIEDGRWIPAPVTGSAFDPLTIRHGGKADVVFTDGHVVPVTPDFGSDTNNSLPNL